jgi:prepilin-type processing-associated H-X9-DG protein
MGALSDSGVLGMNTQIKFRDITDGSSNVMVIGEQSDYYYTTTGAKKDWRTSGGLGYQIGVGTYEKPPNLANVNPFSFNFYSVRYPINKNRGWPDPIGDIAQGVGMLNPDSGANAPPYSFITGINNPLNSAHAGGINALMGDGAVRFLGDSTDLSILARLATRDDGQPLGEF